MLLLGRFATGGPWRAQPEASQADRLFAPAREALAEILERGAKRVRKASRRLGDEGAVSARRVKKAGFGQVRSRSPADEREHHSDHRDVRVDAAVGVDPRSRLGASARPLRRAAARPGGR